MLEKRGYSIINHCHESGTLVPLHPASHRIAPTRGPRPQLSSAIIFVILVKVQWGMMQKVQLTDPVQTHANCVNNTYTICILFLGRLDF